MKFFHLIGTRPEQYYLFFIDLVALEAALGLLQSGDAFAAARRLAAADRGVIPLAPELARAYLRDSIFGVWVGDDYYWQRRVSVWIDVVVPSWEAEAQDIEEDVKGLWLSLCFGQNRKLVYIDHQILGLARASS